MQELTKNDFEKEVLQSDIPVIVDFHASWCGPCQMMGPVFEKVSEDYEGKVKFVKVSTETEQDLASQYEIRSIPCLVVFKNGKESDRIIGFRDEDELKKDVDKIL